MSQANPLAQTEREVSGGFVADDALLASLSVEPLKSGAEGEVLAFLAARPAHTFGMVNRVSDNGLESPSNRGSFYACRAPGGSLAGVALFGHATLFETRLPEALVALARAARPLPPTHLIFGEREKVRLFWENYAPAEQPPRVVRAMLLEQRYPVEVPPPVPELRQADLGDVEQVAVVHAKMAERESGVNPLVVDPEGFRARTAQRVEKGRVWVCTSDGSLNFKADVVTETPEVIYLEGVYVHPEQRGKGFGFRCFAKLVQELLKRTQSVVVLVNEENNSARALYERAGFRLKSHYEMIYPLAPR